MASDRGVKKARQAKRDVDHRGARTDKSPRVARKSDPGEAIAVCKGCEAVYFRSTWRRGRTLDRAARRRARSMTCPACVQVARGEAYGKLLLRGGYVRAHEVEIRRRIDNVAKRAEFTQPERRVVSIDWNRTTLEVLTTSEKLAHRIGRELTKTFGGRATYVWAERDGSLLATWDRESEADAPARRAHR